MQSRKGKKKECLCPNNSMSKLKGKKYEKIKIQRPILLQALTSSFTLATTRILKVNLQKCKSINQLNQKKFKLD